MITPLIAITLGWQKSLNPTFNYAYFQFVL